MLVTLHVSVWVEIHVYVAILWYFCVTLYVSVWVEIYFGTQFSKNGKGHAPRERVSWNFQFDLYCLNIPVTLHVSVWVEMTTWKSLRTFSAVTLHVSVWVEITLNYISNQNNQSRSTWACELKFLQWLKTEYVLSHAPRERVSWNFRDIHLIVKKFSHAPRERVSWNTG